MLKPCEVDYVKGVIHRGEENAHDDRSAGAVRSANLGNDCKDDGNDDYGDARKLRFSKYTCTEY